MLARMVEAATRRIVAVVGGDDAIVRRTHRSHDLGHAPVEGFEAGGVARHVAAMAPFGVEVDEIDEDEAAVRRGLERVEQEIDIVVVVPALDLAPGVAMGEDVADLADGDDGASGLRGASQQVPVAAAESRNPCGAACG